MKFGYTIIYVSDVASSLIFFEQAFGFSQKFIDPSGDYGELITGETTLSFAAHALGKANLPDGYVASDLSAKPLGVEIALITDSITSGRLRQRNCTSTSDRRRWIRNYRA